jgi:ABC-type polysaccharide transport system permease subunit
MKTLKKIWKHRAHVVMALPALVLLIVFDYVPMGGLILAFKKFDYRSGIWGSPWNGLENFRFLIASKSIFLNITKNTLMYYVGLEDCTLQTICISKESLIWSRHWLSHPINLE